MAAVTFIFTVRDGASTPPGQRKSGLSPTWVHFKKLSDNSDLAQPTITEVANGQYKFSFDPAASGEAVGQIDAGVSITNDSDRYIDQLCAGVVDIATGVWATSIADITSDADARSSIGKMLRAVFNRFYDLVTQTIAEQKVYNDSGALVATMPSSDDDTTATKGKSA